MYLETKTVLEMNVSFKTVLDIHCIYIDVYIVHMFANQDCLNKLEQLETIRTLSHREQNHLFQIV